MQLDLTLNCSSEKDFFIKTLKKGQKRTSIETKYMNNTICWKYLIYIDWGENISQLMLCLGTNFETRYSLSSFQICSLDKIFQFLPPVYA